MGIQLFYSSSRRAEPGNRYREIGAVYYLSQLLIKSHQLLIESHHLLIKSRQLLISSCITA